MHNGFIKQSTPSGEIIINFQTLMVKTESLCRYEDKERFNGYCKDGCENYSRYWGCPPFSPSYEEFSKGRENALIVLYYGRLDQFGSETPKEKLVLHAHNFLKSQIDKLMYSLEEEYDGVSILNGHCQLCGTCECAAGNCCRQPDKMRYSMEALGLDIMGVSSELFQHEILWYANGTLPEYSTILSCFLTNQKLDETCIDKFLICKKGLRKR